MLEREAGSKFVEISQLLPPATPKKRTRRGSDLEHLHHLVAEVVDDFHGDAAGFGLGEGPGGVAVEAGPGFLVDFGSQRRFQGLVGVGGGAEEKGVADKEAFLIVIGVVGTQR
jgi:hypothetical protein